MVLNPFRSETDVRLFKPTDLVHTFVMHDPTIPQGQKTFLSPTAWTDGADMRLALIELKPKLKLNVEITNQQMTVAQYVQKHARMIPAMNQLHEAHRVAFLERWSEWHFGAPDPKKVKAARKGKRKKQDADLPPRATKSKGGIIIPPPSSMP